MRAKGKPMLNGDRQDRMLKDLRYLLFETNQFRAQEVAIEVTNLLKKSTITV